jgi:hypothetical protein
MFIFSKNHVLTINLILCSTLLFSCSKSIAGTKKTKEYKTLSEIQHPSEKSPSFSNKFAETRTKTEFLDDQTEKILNQNKTPILLGVIIFIGLFIQSLISYRKN